MAEPHDTQGTARHTVRPAEKVQQGLREAKVVGVLRATGAEEALAKAERAVAAGLRVIEVTFTVPAAANVIASLVENHPEVLVGAGTVLERSQAQEALVAGASFLVSPHLSETVLDYAAERDLLYVPGALTPAEVHRAAALSGGMVKIFPVARMGGPAYVRDLLAPYPGLQLMVTGGVGLDEVEGYLQAGAGVVGLGSVFGLQNGELQRLLARLR